ncbi:hypothetical protein [Amycolatopsis sp. NPDC051903]|uniref:hypothetical protein n=1 Tax=Amycolatopsis sp. NPDC051903 TaxID=3363936 RepID=UPI0037B02794
MAKNSIPQFKTGGGILSKLIGTALVIAVLVLVVKHPGDSGSAVHGAFAFASTAIDGLVDFIRAVFNQ